ncbi:MAG: hypothetical protein E7047_07450 [Lentisphaerae bacterium]|nr:hypothetical protein [Lentisphaerota bacterium]
MDVKENVGKVANKLGIAPKMFVAGAAAIVAVIVAAVIIIVICCSGGAKKAALKYQEALLAGNVDIANKYSVTDMHESNKEQIKVWTETTNDETSFARVEALQKLQEMQEGYVIVEKDYAILFNKFDAPVCKLKKISGEWKVWPSK